MDRSFSATCCRCASSKWLSTALSTCWHRLHWLTSVPRKLDQIIEKVAVENHCNKLKEKSKTLQLWIPLQLKIIFVRPKKHLATQVTSPPGCRPVKFDSKRVWRLREAMGAMMLHEKQKDLKPVSLGLAEGSSNWPRGHNLPMLPRFSTYKWSFTTHRLLQHWHLVTAPA